MAISSLIRQWPRNLQNVTRRWGKLPLIFSKPFAGKRQCMELIVLLSTARTWVDWPFQVSIIFGIFSDLPKQCGWFQTSLHFFPQAEQNFWIDLPHSLRFSRVIDVFSLLSTLALTSTGVSSAPEEFSLPNFLPMALHPALTLPGCTAKTGSHLCSMRSYSSYCG